MNWQALILASLTQPREVARALVAWNPPIATRWQAMVLLTIISTLMTSVAIAFAGPDNLLGPSDPAGPIVSAGIELCLNLLTVLLATGVGHLAGGQGRFSDALLLMGWVQFLLLLWQIPLCIALVLAPPLVLLLLSVSIVLWFWLLAQFIAALHNFTSAMRVFFGVLGMVFLFGAALSPFLQPMFATG